ncbi:uncharacterized protein LOC133176896 [Saccostrea echinata]|uniref:uncharacterized protein LOC133176896 n=1 Tax=Saccostrea echinata TaxID=191078 RepID=UPI002A7F08E3|nr:uncharacterized protein LOC133176896 [Saccostrea echinata]
MTALGSRVAVTISSLYLILPTCIQAESYRNYTFGKDCFVSTKELSKDKPMTVYYRGSKNVGVFCNGMAFECNENSDSCNVCVTIKEFNDPDCVIILQFKESWTEATEHTITCRENNKKKYCRDSSVYILLNLISTKSPSRASFDLLITSEEEETDWAVVGGLIGGVFGGIILITVVVAVLLCIACKRRRSPGYVHNPGNSVPMTNQSNPSYPSTGYPQYTYGGYPTQSPTGSYPTQPTAETQFGETAKF